MFSLVNNEAKHSVNGHFQYDGNSLNPSRNGSDVARNFCNKCWQFERQAGLPIFCVDDPTCILTFYVGNPACLELTDILEGISATRSRWVKFGGGQRGLPTFYVLYVQSGSCTRAVNDIDYLLLMLQPAKCVMPIMKIALEFCLRRKFGNYKGQSAIFWGEMRLQSDGWLMGLS